MSVNGKLGYLASFGVPNAASGLLGSASGKARAELRRFSSRQKHANRAFLGCRLLGRAFGNQFASPVAT